jgi:hypothetical protein
MPHVLPRHGGPARWRTRGPNTTQVQDTSRPDTGSRPDATPAPTLHTCPDCGGILEPSDPVWEVVIQPLGVAPTQTPSGTGQWQCLICGYRKP